MPNPEWEGIGKHIEEADVKAGGDSLKNSIMITKVKIVPLTGHKFITGKAAVRM